MNLTEGMAETDDLSYHCPPVTLPPLCAITLSPTSAPVF